MSTSRLLSMARSACWRTYQDYLMPSRLPEYARLLTLAREQGYRLISVEQWAALLADPTASADTRALVLRHDVDTDARLTLPWSQIEQDHGAGASYFYRLSTIDDQAIETVMKRGFHVSYHFEELADVAKARGLRSAAEVIAHMDEIRDRFAANLRALRGRFGWDARIVCSHGDWMNRRLQMRNLELLSDPAFRRQNGIEYETYDEALMTPLRGYYTDAQPPAYWRESGSPFDAIRAGVAPIGLLTHPRQWQPCPRDNAAETWRRLREGLAYRRNAQHPSPPAPPGAPRALRAT
ncbi:MAG: hypothetical protein QM674_09270 [Burkholderiaceae bacterium]